MSIAYRVDGPEDAPALVLSNSLGTTWDLWEAQVPDLSRDFRVVRYDHPGHGRSAYTGETLTIETLVGQVLELLDRLELERASFCGLSLGGAVGVTLAQSAPDRVDRLVLACTSASFGPPEGWLERARLVRVRGTAVVAEGVLERWFTAEFRADRPETVTRFRRMLEATPREGYAACCEAIAHWDARGSLEAVAAPTLVIAGADDPATPPSDAAFLAESIPDATLAVLPGAAHLANVEQPELFTKALFAHLVPAGTREEAA